jgi:hypothetical protein
MVAFHNSSIRRGRQATPYSLFTGQDAPWTLNDFRVFGCPVYILHKRLQDGDNINKWKSRSWQGVYNGPSTCHASNIPLVYNPTTTHISPQFHVVYDESFTSITSLPSPLADDLMNKLFEKAFWSHDTGTANTVNTHDFATFWVPPNSPNNKRKRHQEDAHSSLP